MIDDLKRLRDNYYEMFTALDIELRANIGHPDENKLLWVHKDLQRLRTNCQEAIDRIDKGIDNGTGQESGSECQ